MLEIRRAENKIVNKSKHEIRATSALSQPDIFKKISRVSTMKRLFDLKRPRMKRSTVFPTGVKVCPQESVKQIIASHLAYYRLRVCQEAVWEAFRIFMDRIPQTLEYQTWVDACQQDSFCIFDIGKNFSSSQEHLDIIQQRAKDKRIPEKKDEMSTEAAFSPVIIEDPPVSTTGFPHSEPAFFVTTNDTLLNEIINDTKPLLKETEVTNLVPEQPKQQIVEFTVTLNNQEFTAELSDPNSPRYQELSTSFQLQMQKVFEKLPGFKEIQVLRFRQKKEKDGSDSIVVRYAVVFERGSSESKNTIDETPTIASNKVENGNNKEAKEMSYTVIELQQMVAMALQDDRSLAVDLQTLMFSDDPDMSSDHVESDAHPPVTVVTSKMKTDNILIAKVPAGNPTAETVIQATDYGVNTIPFIPGKEMTNEIADEAPTELNTSTYMTVSYAEEEYETPPTLFQHETNMDLQTQSLEGLIKDINNKVNEGFTVPFDIPYANNKESQDELEIRLEHNSIDTSSETTSDIKLGFLPSSVETNNLVMSFSTLIPDADVPLIDDLFKGSERSLATTTAFIYNTTAINIFKTEYPTEMSGDDQNNFAIEKTELTVEPPTEHILEKIEDSRISTVPSMTEGFPKGDEIYVEDSMDGNLPTDKTYFTSHTSDTFTSENNNVIFSEDETSTLKPASISTIKTLPAYIDSNLVFVSPTQELHSDIATISHSEVPNVYEETSPMSIIKLSADTTQELPGEPTQGIIQESTPEPLQLFDRTIQNFEVFEVTTLGEVGILDKPSPTITEVFEETGSAFEQSTLRLVRENESPSPKIVEVTEQTIKELIPLFEETTQMSTDSSTTKSIHQYNDNSDYSTLENSTLSSTTVLESSFTYVSIDKENDNEVIGREKELEGNMASTPSLDILTNNSKDFSSLEHFTSSTEPSVDKGKELVVFFSLRVTNMPFSDDLFNKSSPEYRALEQQFIHLLLPYLQTNLTGFKHLEILNFRKGSVIVNSKLKFAKSVPYNVTEAVHCVLEDFCNAAAQFLNLQIDSYSLDIEPADQADLCKFMACDEFSECSVNSYSKEASCVCKPGFISNGGLPCQSICELDPIYCSEGEECKIEDGKGAVCSCLKGKSRFHSGRHCSTAAIQNLSLFIVAVSSGAIFLALIVLKLAGKMYGGSNHKTQSEVNVKSFSLHSPGKIIPYQDGSLNSPNKPTDHRRTHAPQHTQPSVRSLPVSIVPELMKSRQ
ncbi:interphotoreceptor matrix proteoglycan 1 [Rhinoderma darwinii]|uniref:interphotoreceptor matrix proteoglycan 1 n=1 Tax=Rhinoderma darwinii TaxID=43563 RepID=UPI003F6743D4